VRGMGFSFQDVTMGEEGGRQDKKRKKMLNPSLFMEIIFGAQ